MNNKKNTYGVTNSKKADYKNANKLFENRIVDDEKLLTKQEIADFLNVSIKMIDRKVLMNEIPYLKVGRLVRFSKSVVLVWAEEKTSKG